MILPLTLSQTHGLSKIYLGYLSFLSFLLCILKAFDEYLFDFFKQLSNITNNNAYSICVMHLFQVVISFRVVTCTDLYLGGRMVSTLLVLFQ